LNRIYYEERKSPVRREEIMNKHGKRIFLLILFIAVIVLVRFSAIGDYITFENIKKNRDILLAFTKEHYLISVILYIVLYVLIVALSIPGGAVLTLAGGFLFGTLLTVLYVNVGATLGATFAFLIARYLIGDRLQHKYKQQLVNFNEEIAKNGVRYLLTLRFIPVFPFFLINFLSGLTSIPLTTFIWTTSLGILPGTAVYAYAGQQLGAITTVSEILSTKVLVVFLLLGLFAVFPILLNYGKKKVLKKS
jgi:uncharacterized membrane protein YdjX (TVP38/TMEM64 family)